MLLPRQTRPTDRSPGLVHTMKAADLISDHSASIVPQSVCCRDTFSGCYSTSAACVGTVKIHDGPCTCDNQCVPDCVEPGDNP